MGVGDVPASGFALYLDQLMNLIKAEAIAPAKKQKILIRALSDDGVKEAFKAADSLRRAGYITEHDMDGQEAGWMLEVRSKAPLYTLIDKKKSVRFEAQTMNEVLKRLEGEGVAKNRSA